MAPKHKPRPEREYLVREYGSEGSTEDGINALSAEGYEVDYAYLTHKPEEGRMVTVIFRRARQTVLIVKQT